MRARLIKTSAFVVTAALTAAACGGSGDTSRTRNATRDGYEVPAALLYEYEDAFDRSVSREWGAGYSTAGPDKWDPNTYDVGQGRARAASPVYEEVGPRVPPRQNRPAGAAPPIYERPVAGKTAGGARVGTTAPKVPSGATMKTGNIGKVLGGLGNIGASMAGSIAMAGIGMALGALGAPPFLMSLFGGPDAATMAMLEAIMDMLKEMDKKLDTIIEKLDTMQVSVNDIGSSIQLLAGSVCSEGVTQTTRDLSAVTDPITTQWLKVFVENKLAAGEKTTNTFSDDEKDYFNDAQKAVREMKPLERIERIESLVLGDGDIASATGAQSGLLSQVQKCTLAQKRFLTNADTAQWQALVMLLMVSQGRAAQLAVWEEVYSAMQAGRSPNLTTINQVNLALRHSMSNMGFQVSMQIPEGQVLDTVTNKMWRMAPSGTAKVGLQDALTGCLPDEDRFLNYAPVPSWDGTGTRDLNMCVATRDEALKTSNNVPSGSPLDRGADMGDPRGDLAAGDWRIPTAAEITMGGTKFAASGAPGTVGLIDSGANKSGASFKFWKEAKCGPQRGRDCITPAEYLATYGFAGVPTDLGIVWSNTTYTKIGEGGKNGSTPWSLQNTWNTYNRVWNPSGNGIYGFCEDDREMGGLGELTCIEDNFFVYPVALKHFRIPRIPGPRSVFGTFANGATRDNFCFRVSAATTFKKGNTKNSWYNPFTAEVTVFNLGSTGTNAGPVSAPINKDKSMKDVTTPRNYRETIPGQYTAYFASREVTNASIACRHDWYAGTHIKLPQTAQAMWVRNLGPNEAYYSVAGSTGPTGVADLRSFQRNLQPATVSILSMNGKAVIHSRIPRNAVEKKYFVKCVINPETDPLTPEDVVNAGTDCPTFSINLPDGPYRIYAVTTRQANGRTVMSNIEVADIALSTALAQVAGIPPVTSTPETTLPAPTELGIASTGSTATTAPVGTGSTPATAVPTTTTASTGVSDTGPSTAPATSASTSTIDLATLLSRAKLKPRAGDKVSVTVAAASKSVCRYEKPTLIGLKSGRCRVTVTLRPKAGAKKSKTLSIKVTG